MSQARQSGMKAVRMDSVCVCVWGRGPCRESERERGRGSCVTCAWLRPSAPQALVVSQEKGKYILSVQQ